MTRQIKYFIWIWFIAALIATAILLPSPILAQNFSVAPAEVKIENLSPGDEAEFELTIYNKDNISHTFILTAYNPEKSQRRPGRAELPDDGWINFSPQEVEVAASSDAKVKVEVAIPSNQEWAGKIWEIWLRVAPKDKDFLAVNYYIRLLVSTSGEVRSVSDIGLFAGIIAVLLLLGCGVYYFRCKTKPK